MQTTTAAKFFTEGQPAHKFPHTGPVDYGYGRKRYGAAFKGELLKNAKGKNRLFMTVAGAHAAIIEASHK